MIRISEHINMKSIALTISLILFVNCSSKMSTNNLPVFEDNKLNLQGKLWEKPAFEEIDTRLYGTKIESLKTKKQVSESKEIRIWVGFDASPLRGIVLVNNKINGMLIIFRRKIILLMKMRM